MHGIMKFSSVAVFLFSVALAPAVHAQSGGGSVSATARAFAVHYFDVSGQSDPLPWMARHYADNVNFFGKSTPRAAVLKQKADYIARWPERSYDVEPDSVRVECETHGPRCHVSGLIDWTVRSLDRNARSSGTSSFDLTIVQQGGQGTIVSESGTVLERAHP